MNNSINDVGFDLESQREARRQDDLTFAEKLQTIFWLFAKVFLTFAIAGYVVFNYMPLQDIPQ